MSYKSLAPKLIYLLALLAPLSLLITWSATIYPYVFVKAWMFRAVVEAMFLLWLPLALAHPEFCPRKSLVWWGLGAFIASALISVIFGVGFYKSFWGNTERMEGVFGLMHYAAYAVMLAGIARRSENQPRTVMRAYCGVSLLAIGTAFIEAGKTGYGRFSGVAGNPSFLAAQLVFAVVFSLLLAAMTERVWEKRFFLGLTALFMYAILRTGTRGAFVGIVAGALVYGVLAMIGTIKKFNARVAGVAALALLLFILGGWYFVLRGRPISFSDPNISSRIDAISVSMNAWKERPLFGWGPENFNIAYNKHLHPEIISLYPQRQWFDRAHNKVLDVLVMQGSAGIVAYAFLLIALCVIFWRMRKVHPFIARIGIAGTAVYVVHNLFVFDVMQSYIGLAMLMTYASSLPLLEGKARRGWEQKNDLDKSHPSSLLGKERAAMVLPVSTGALLAILLVAPAFWYGTIKPVRAAVLVQRAVSLDPRVNPGAPQNLNDVERNRVIIRTFQQAIAERSFVTWEALLLLQRFYTGEVGSGLLAVERNDLAYLASQLRDATRREPARYEVFLALGEILNIWGSTGEAAAYDEAAKVVDIAIELAPKVPRVWYANGTMLMGQAKTIEAITAYKRAVELNPDIAESHWTLGSAYLMVDDYVHAAESLDEAQLKGYAPRNTYMYEQLFRAYGETSQYDKLEPVLKKLIELQPTNARWHAVLAATYKGMRRFDDARSEVQKAVELDPTFKKEAEIFLKTL